MLSKDTKAKMPQLVTVLLSDWLPIPSTSCKRLSCTIFFSLLLLFHLFVAFSLLNTGLVHALPHFFHLLLLSLGRQRQVSLQRMKGWCYDIVSLDKGCLWIVPYSKNGQVVIVTGVFISVCTGPKSRTWVPKVHTACRGPKNITSITPQVHSGVIKRHLLCTSM